MTYGRAVPTKHYGRVFYNLEASNTGGNPYTHTTFVQAAGRNPQIVDTVRTADGREDYNLAWADDFGKSSQYSYRVELGRWVCVEWQFASGAGTFALWVDGRPVAGPTGPLPRAVPAVFPGMAFGAQVYQPQAAVSGWLDDIAVSIRGSKEVPAPTKKLLWRGLQHDA